MSTFGNLLIHMLLLLQEFRDNHFPKQNKHHRLLLCDNVQAHRLKINP